MTLHHRIDGDGERVLVLSGSLGTTLELWTPHLAALTAEFRIVRYDHPGHGGSPPPPPGATVDDFADGVLQLLERLGVERFSFCGLSLGGAVGLAMARRATGELDRLVLCCTAAKIATPELWAERAATVRSAGLEAIADAVVCRWFTPEYAAMNRATVQRYRAMLAATPQEGYARSCEVLRACDARSILGFVDVPTLVIAGGQDPVVPREDAAELARGIPAARLALLEPAAHLANVERRDEFNRELLAHLTADVAV